MKNKKYFIKQIPFPPAYQFTCQYHYSHHAFKGAKINLGIFRLDNNQMVGVAQWGHAAAPNIRLDRYVKEEIQHDEYLELNRFCMAEEEGHNSESQAISLCLKWIKQNCPNIRLLVSYAGRRDGHYGFIYQATNWEYLGYFMSDGFWYLDGEEYQNRTLYQKYSLHGDKSLSVIDAMCELYHDVRQTRSKQFIYIQRLDKSLTPASEILPYPKESNAAPVVTKVKIFKQNDDYFVTPPASFSLYYYWSEKENKVRRKMKNNKIFVQYNIGGELEKTGKSISELVTDEYSDSGIRKSIKTEKTYKDKYFRLFKDEEPAPELDVKPLLYIDDIPFYKKRDITAYVKTSRQNTFELFKRHGKSINGKAVVWEEDYELQ